MWIKLCANTNLEDALFASELGVDAIGFVFARSPRQVTPAQVAAITSHLPDDLETVGVFSAWQAPQIVEAVQQAKLRTIQLHGATDLPLIRALDKHFKGCVSIVQVLHWHMDAAEGQATHIAEEIAQLAALPEITRVLIDSKCGSLGGGTGVAFPWAEATAIFRAHPQTILAGGLHPANIMEAIEHVHPWGIDVASGVEAFAGKKDPGKVSAFVAAARRASSSLKLC